MYLTELSNELAFPCSREFLKFKKNEIYHYFYNVCDTYLDILSHYSGKCTRTMYIVYDIFR